MVVPLRLTCLGEEFGKAGWIEFLDSVWMVSCFMNILCYTTVVLLTTLCLLKAVICCLCLVMSLFAMYMCTSIVCVDRRPQFIQFTNRNTQVEVMCEKPCFGKITFIIATRLAKNSRIVVDDKPMHQFSLNKALLLDRFQSWRIATNKILRRFRRWRVVGVW